MLYSDIMTASLNKPSEMHATSPVHLIIVDLITNIRTPGGFLEGDATQFGTYITDVSEEVTVSLSAVEYGCTRFLGNVGIYEGG
jgi:hypothetical protein